MSTYLVCFIISNFTYLEAHAADVAVRVYAPADRINSMQFALNIATKVLTVYNEYFAIPYKHSMPKLGTVFLYKNKTILFFR